MDSRLKNSDCYNYCAMPVMECGLDAYIGACLVQMACTSQRDAKVISLPAFDFRSY